MGDLSENFSSWEFVCRGGCGKVEMDADFIAKLQTARMLAGIPFNINSGYRCKAQNFAIGGNVDSLHLQGQAADISTDGQSHDAYLILFALHDAGFRRFKLYPKHIHVDSGMGKRPDLLMWGRY